MAEVAPVPGEPREGKIEIGQLGQQFRALQWTEVACER